MDQTYKARILKTLHNLGWKRGRRLLVDVALGSFVVQWNLVHVGRSLLWGVDDVGWCKKLKENEDELERQQVKSWERCC